jgi:nucleoside diphosphate kinase
MASPFNKKPFKMYDVTECSKTRRGFKRSHFECMTSHNAQTKGRGFKRSHFEFMTSQNVQKRGVASKEAILNV